MCETCAEHSLQHEASEKLPDASSYLFFVADDVITEDSLVVCDKITNELGGIIHPTILLRGNDIGFVKDAVAFCKSKNIPLGNHFNPFGAPPEFYNPSHRTFLGHDGVYAKQLAYTEGASRQSLSVPERLGYHLNRSTILHSLEEEYDALGTLLGQAPEVGTVHLDCFRDIQFLRAWSEFTQKHPDFIYRYRRRSVHKNGDPIPVHRNKLCADDTIDEFNREVTVSRADVVNMIAIKEQVTPGYGLLREVVTHLDRYSKDRRNAPTLDVNHVSQWNVFLDPVFWQKDLPEHNWIPVNTRQVRSLKKN